MSGSFSLTATKNGFTIIEIVVVMLIIALGSSVFLGYQLSQRETLQLRSGGRQLALYLRQAKSYAVLKGAANSCYYQTETRTISQDLNDRSLTLPGGVILRLTGQSSGSKELLITRFFADGSSLLSTFAIVNQDRSMQCRIDPILGTVDLSGVSLES